MFLAILTIHYFELLIYLKYTTKLKEGKIYMINNFILSGFSDEIASDFQVQLKEMKALDIAYIEIRGVNGKNITEHTIEEVKIIKKDLDAVSMKVSAVGSPLGKIHIKDDFAPHYELFKHTVEIARLLDN